MEKTSGKNPSNSKKKIKGERTNGLVNGVNSEICNSHKNKSIVPDEINHKADANENCLQPTQSETISVDGCETKSSQTAKKRKNKGKTKQLKTTNPTTESDPTPIQLALELPSTSTPNRLENEIENIVSDVAKLDLSETIELPVTDVVEHVEEVIVPSNLPEIHYVQYESEEQMTMIMRIIQRDLSEPYSIYTYRYFIHNWPKLCFLAMCEEKCVGAIVCKLDFHRKSTKRGYIAMLAVDKEHRKRSIGSTLVSRAIHEMIAGGAGEVVLETEVTNVPALRLYEQLGFVRDKRLFRYYLNGVDALRLKLWLR